MILCISVLSVVISPFSLLILLIWLFSLFYLMSLANGLSVLLIFSKNQALVLLMFAILSLVCFSLTSAMIFIISFLLLMLGSFFSSFSSCFQCSYLFDFAPVSWSMLVLLWMFPLALLLLNPVGFGLLCLHFHCDLL